MVPEFSTGPDEGAPLRPPCWNSGAYKCVPDLRYGESDTAGPARSVNTIPAAPRNATGAALALVTLAGRPRCGSEWYAGLVSQPADRSQLILSQPQYY